MFLLKCSCGYRYLKFLFMCGNVTKGSLVEFEDFCCGGLTRAASYPANFSLSQTMWLSDLRDRWCFLFQTFGGGCRPGWPCRI